MYRRLSIGVAALALVFALGACTTTGQYYGGQQYNQAEIRSGVIEQITPVEIASNQHSGVGAVVGRSRYAEKVHLTAPRIILHDHALAYEGVILHNFVEIRQHEHIIINTL